MENRKYIENSRNILFKEKVGLSSHYELKFIHNIIPNTYLFLSCSITRSWRSVHLLFTWRCGARWTVSKLAQNWGNFSKLSLHIGIRHYKRYPELTKTKRLILHILSRKSVTVVTKGTSQNIFGSQNMALQDISIANKNKTFDSFEFVFISTLHISENSVIFTKKKKLMLRQIAFRNKLSMILSFTKLLLCIGIRYSYNLKE